MVTFLSWHSLRFRFFLIVLLITSLVLIVAIQHAVEQRRQAEIHAEQQAISIARSLSNRQKQLIDAAHHLLVGLAELPETKSDGKDCAAKMAQIHRHFPVYANLGAITPSGDAYCSSVPLESAVNAADRSWFQRTIEFRGLGVGEFTIGRITGAPVLPIGYPVVDVSGSIRAVVFAALSLSWLSEFAAERQLPSDSVIVVFDHQGVVAGRYPDPEKWVGRSLRDTSLFNATSKARDEGHVEAIALDGIERFYAFAPVGTPASGQRLFVALGRLRHDIFASADQTLYRHLLWITFVILSLLALLWYGFDEFFLRRLKSLESAAQKLARGELTARTGRTGDQSELGKLAHTFDRMAEALQLRQQELDAAHRQRDETLQLLDTIFQSAPVGLAFIDRELRFVRINDELAAMNGFPAKDHIGRTVSDVLPRLAADLEPLYRRIIETGEPVTQLEVSGETPSAPGKKRHWLASYYPVKNDRQDVLGIGATVQEITARKRAEQELQASERRFRAIFEQAGTGVALIDSMTGRFLEINQRYCDIVGYTHREMTSKIFQEITHPDDLEADLDHMAKVRAGEIQHFSMEKRYYHKNGSIVWVRLTVTPTWLSEQSPHNHIAMIDDITERKLAEDALRRSEAQFRAMAEASPVGIFLVKPDGNVVYGNPADLRLLGTTLEGVCDANWVNAIHPEDREKAVADWNAAMGRGLPYHGEGRYLHADGTVVWWDVTTAPVMVDNALIGFVGMVVDITERKRAQEIIEARVHQQEAVADLGQLALSGVSADHVMQTATEMIAENVRADYAKVLEILPGENRALLRAGVGWKDAYVGRAQIDLGSESQAGYTLQCQGPVIVEDLRTETRFSGPPLLHDHGVVSGMSVVIGQRHNPYGVLGIHTREPRSFTEDDTNFIKAVANILADAVGREREAIKLQQSRRQLRALAARIERVREGERIHIAREIHDVLGQLLTGIKMDLSWVKGKMRESGNGLKDKLVDTAKLVDEAVNTVQQIATDLRPGILDNLGLQAAVEWQAQDFEKRTGIQCRCSCSIDEIAVDTQLTTTFFRSLQESLTNVVRHARATRVEITLKQSQGTIVLQVSDNGRGVKPHEIADPKSLGLLGIRERIELAGGRFDIRGDAGKGTTVTMSVPDTGPPPQPYD